MNWLEQSFMWQRGVGADRNPVEHLLSEHLQSIYHYTIGPYSDPVLHIKPGITWSWRRRDAFDGAIKSETDKPSELLHAVPQPPERADHGGRRGEGDDVLAVYIEKMSPRGDNPHGVCAMIPNFGGLTGTDYTAILNEPLPEKVRIVVLDEENVYWSKRNTLPYR